MSIDAVAQLFNKFGFGIGVTVLASVLVFFILKYAKDMLDRKDKEIQNLTERVFELQGKAIESNNSLVTAINANTEVTKASLQTQNTLVQSVYEVLAQVKRK